jgi:hypothetical protein
MNALLRELYSRLGSYRDAGANVYFNCPFCGDTRRRLGISLEKGVYGCFNCDEGGTLPSLLRRLQIEASLPRPSHERQKPILESSVQWPEHSVAVSLARKGYLASRAKDYLKSRRLKMTWCVRNQVRYTTRGRLADRVVFPSVRDGKLEYWVARAISDDVKPKTLHPTGISRPIWTYQTWEPEERIVITEGVFDAIAAGGCATLGCGVSKAQIQELAAFGVEEYVIAFDGDKDGRVGAHKLADALSRETSAKISIVKLPDDSDPADLGTEAMREFIEKRKEYTLADYVSALM